MGHALLTCHYIKQMVDAITEVDIGVPTPGKHGFGAFGVAVAIRVAGFVIRRSIGLDFDNAAGGAARSEIRYQIFAQ